MIELMKKLNSVYQDQITKKFVVTRRQNNASSPGPTSTTRDAIIVNLMRLFSIQFAFSTDREMEMKS